MIKRKISFYYLLSSVLFLLIVVSCAPVLRKDLMQAGTREFSLDQLRGNPIQYQGKLYILGGLIVSAKNTERGSLIEAVYIPVNSLGYLKGREYADGRFLALFPGSAGYLDPEIYRKGREITVAGEFTGVQRGKLDQADYIYPVFGIKQIYLWPEERRYYMGGPYYGYPYGPYSPFYYPPYTTPYAPYWWNDPFWRTRVPPWW